MKLFGEYLIERNIVSTEQMVAALIRQTSKLPGMAEIAYNKKLLRPDQLFKIMKIQNEQHSGFIEAAKELNIWNEQLSKQFETIADELRTPLIQILIEMEAAKLESITHALDDFLGDVKDSIESGSLTVEPIEKIEVIEPIQQTDSSPTSVLSSTYSGYCQLFTEDKKKMIENALDQLQNGGISISVMTTLKDHLHALVTAARNASAKMSENVLNCMEGMMDQILATPASNINEEFITRIGKVNLDAIDFLWQLSVKLQTGQNEDELMLDTDLKKNYEKIAAAVEITKFDLDFLS
jgi:HPt (histidine-containing phosphotransfer) domain-containing protein